MNSIKKLAPELVNKISAGEVVDRPASAIKELIDNSIDAGANKIQIEILDKSARNFRITDDGKGIKEDEIELAFALHATSKISNIDDLNNISTKGFRGEALAAISSVSDISCISKHINSDKAYKVAFNEAGEIIKSIGVINKGTSIEVKELFAKVAARLKFLKKSETELQIIYDCVKSLAIAHPEIQFELKLKDKVIFNSSGSANWKIATKEIFQEEIPFKSIESELEDDQIKLAALIAPLSFANSNSNSVMTIVNKRPIQCQVMKKAVKEVYSGILPRNKYPRIVLYLTMPFDKVDVNVHPTKREVRYYDASKIYLLVKRAIEKHLILNSGAPLIDDEKEPQKIEIEAENIKSELEFDEDALDFRNRIAEKKLVDLLEEGEINKEKSDLIKEEFRKLIEAKKQETLIQNSLDPITQKIKDEFRKKKSLNFNININYENSCLNSNINCENQELKEFFEKYIEEFLVNLKELIKASEGSGTNEQLNIIKIETSSKYHRKANRETLEKIWKRDGWRCVYCGKYLLHPLLVRESIKKDPFAKIKKLTLDNKLIEVHPLREHLASYDHLIPFSQVSSLDEEENNLYACCKECNQRKSNSIDYNKWKPKKFAPWINQEVQIGNLIFKSGQ